MNTRIGQNLAIFFPLFFAALWLTVTTITGALSGWFRLAANFPNQEGEPLLRIRGCSARMGFGVNLNRVLTLSVCSMGLRVGMMRVFGPFCRDFFVPWESIRVTRKKILFWPMAKLQFGYPEIGTLSIRTQVADKLARAAMGRWPESGSFPEEGRKKTIRRLLIQWTFFSSLAALCFVLGSRIFAPKVAWPPIAVAILFPAIVFGAIMIVRFLNDNG